MWSMLCAVSWCIWKADVCRDLTNSWRLPLDFTVPAWHWVPFCSGVRRGTCQSPGRGTTSGAPWPIIGMSHGHLQSLERDETSRALHLIFPPSPSCSPVLQDARSCCPFLFALNRTSPNPTGSLPFSCFFYVDWDFSQDLPNFQFLWKPWDCEFDRSLVIGHVFTTNTTGYQVLES